MFVSLPLHFSCPPFQAWAKQVWQLHLRGRPTCIRAVRGDHGPTGLAPGRGAARFLHLGARIQGVAEGSDSAAVGYHAYACAGKEHKRQSNRSMLMAQSCWQITSCASFPMWLSDLRLLYLLSLSAFLSGYVCVWVCGCVFACKGLQ